MMMINMSGEFTLILTLRHTPLLETHYRIHSVISPHALWNILIQKEDRFLHAILEQRNDVLETVHAIKRTHIAILPLPFGTGEGRKNQSSIQCVRHTRQRQ